MTIETQLLDPSAEGLQISNYTGICQYPFLQQNLFPETGGCMPRPPSNLYYPEIRLTATLQTSADGIAQ